MAEQPVDPIPLTEDMTVLDVLKNLHEQVLRALREGMPATVARLLATWLRSAWAGHRAMLPPPDRLRAEEELLLQVEQLIPEDVGRYRPWGMECTPYSKSNRARGCGPRP